MARRDDEYLVALDLGTRTTRCAIACWRRDGEIVLEGYGEARTLGVSKGLIVDAGGAAESVRRTIEAAAERARVRVYTVLAAVGTPFARGLNSRGCIGIVHDDKIARGNDARRALAAANRISLPADRAVAEVYSQGFAVDDVRGIHNPVGIAGGRLEAEVHVVTDSLCAHANVEQAIRQAGFRPERVVFGPLAAAEAVLASEEKRLGSVHVDIGAETTSVAIYAGGYPRFSRVLPVGCQHITNDLAIGLNTPVPSAAAILRECGIVDSRRPRRKESVATVQVPRADGEAARLVPLWRVGFIVRARVEEIFDLVSKELDRSGVAAAGAARVVLTGGFCQIKGARDAAERILRRAVRFGSVDVESTLSQFEPGPAHAVLLGTLARGVSHRERRYDHRFDEGGWRAMFKRVASWL